MSYVPPHLRAAAAAAAPTASSSPNYRNATPKPFPDGRLLSSNPRNAADFSAYSGRRPSTVAQQPRALPSPEAVFGQWNPSDRVLRLNPEQIEEVRFRLNVDVTVSSDSSPAPAPIESFVDMCLHASIMKDIAYHEYTAPTSIQAQAMPVALSGRDLLGCAETGSGKTAAFAIPMIQHCLAQPPIRQGDGPLALVLAPTRELAQQIEKEVKAFSRSLEMFRTAIVVGGTNIAEQRSELRVGVHIVVATPGRFIDHLQQGNTSLSRISFVVLDEADRMLDMGFEPQIREVMQNLPKKHQTLLFSATMPVEIESLAQEYLSKPVQIKVGKVSSPTANVSQILEKITESEKRGDLARAQAKDTGASSSAGPPSTEHQEEMVRLSADLEAALARVQEAEADANERIDRLLSLLVEEASQVEKSGHPFPLSIVFVERKTKCDEVAEALVAQGLHAVALHGGHSQRERETALHDFRKGSTNILVATDVASRGLDVAGVSHVVNLDLPKNMEDYVHRIGRTGRAGSTGRATSFYTDRDMFLVALIRKAISDAESGNIVSFATGKMARRKEREAAAAQREASLTLSSVSLNGPASITIEDRYRHMLNSTTARKEGAADNAWDD